MVTAGQACHRRQYLIQRGRRGCLALWMQGLVGLGQGAQVAHQLGPGATRSELFDGLVADHDATDPVALLQHREAQQRGGFGGGDRLHGVAAAEEHRHALVDHQQGGAIALFGEHPYMGSAGARGDPPVDVAHVVRWLIVA